MKKVHSVDVTLITNGERFIKSKQPGIGHAHVVNTVRQFTPSIWLADWEKRSSRVLPILFPDSGFIVDAGAKVVAKAHPEEKVGVFALQGGGVSVVEYSELGPELAGKANDAGELLFNWCGPVSKSSPSGTCRMWCRI